MTKSMRKDFRREIIRSFTRFLSILLIVALGVAFFAGILSTAPAMRASADATYDGQNFMDVCVAGTLGITDRDISEISKIGDVQDAEGAYSAEFLCPSNGAQVVTAVLSLTDRINLVKVSEGRFPVSYDECIADAQFLEKTGHQLGDKITLISGNSDELTDTLATDTYTIVGIGSTAYYLSDDRGNTDIGNGIVDAFLIIPKEAFTLKAYTKAFVKVNGTDALNCFSSKYDKLVDNAKNNISSIAETRCLVRYDEFKTESVELISTAQARFETQKKRAMDQFEQAYQTLSDSQSALDIVQSELDGYQQEVEDAKELLDTREENIPNSKQQLEEARKTLAEQEALYNTTSKQLQNNQEIIAKMEEELRQNASKMSADEYADAAFSIYSWKATGQFYKSQLDAIKLAIDQANRRIDNAQLILEGSPEAIADARQKLADGEKNIKQAQHELNTKQAALDKAKEEYELSKSDVVEELNDAQAKLDSYKQRIESTPVPTWYVTGREIVDTYASFDNDAEGISAIGAVFPIIFFLVAALVSLTTMTRMVEEQRLLIGTFKALGYNKKTITGKYILYALLATLIGGIVGAVVGEALIPSTVVQTYKIVYMNLTRIIVPVNIPYAVIAVVISLVCTTGAAYLASRRSLKEVPAELMREQAPTVGKKIGLEKHEWFWMRLSFSQKAALRNLVRYKKRLFMTVFGVAGCVALLLVGFGIRDSVSSMTNNQFSKIWNYQGTVTINENITRTQRRHLLANLQTVEGVTDYLQICRKPYLALNGEKQQDVYLIVPQSVEPMADYITLQSRIGHDEYLPTDDSIVITEKLANMLGASVGDSISFKTSENATESATVKISGIVENYLYHYVYMTPAVYRNLFGEIPNLNTLLIRTNAADDAALAAKILENNEVTSVTMNSITAQKVSETTSRLMIIVFMMIGSAALLAFVVLYNLNNINITERRRELATLKVLGYRPDEVEKYVFRENTIMMFIGILIGIALGIVLHFFVMKSVETDTMMFGKQIKWYSFLISIALTAVFSAIVNFLMSFKLKKIDMIESTKSNE
ncbi:MAG: ABC transporter permease [Clostridiaceae bacterium]|nr:ABC transporter permease [Clostridiaceae bacterium]